MFTTHEAFCNENRSLILENTYLSIFATERKEGRPQKERWIKKEEGTIPTQHILSEGHRVDVIIAARHTVICDMSFGWGVLCIYIVFGLLLDRFLIGSS